MTTSTLPAPIVRERDRSFSAPAAGGDALAFHRALPEYAPTALTDLPALAGELGVGRVLAKDESTRLGLPAFKALGASWAVHRALAGAGGRSMTVTTATDGNHGRAAARYARRAGHRARVWIPRGVHPVAIQAVVDEGGEVTVVDGSYDDAVAAAARAAEAPDHVLVQDMAWEGYEDVPAWIVQGYATLFAEIDEQLAGGAPDLVVVPTGVGSLLQAGLAHYRRPGADPRTAVASVEPTAAACIHASLAAGRPTSVPQGTTVMSGLNCGTPSTAAWPLVAAGLDAATVVDDDAAIRAAHDLAALGLAAGPCGAAALAGLRTLLTGPDAADHRARPARLHLSPDATVVLVVTEGTAANPLPA